MTALLFWHPSHLITYHVMTKSYIPHLMSVKLGKIDSLRRRVPGSGATVVVCWVGMDEWLYRWTGFGSS